jgi:hypothetical protein
MNWTIGLLFAAAVGCAHEQNMTACRDSYNCPGRYSAKASPEGLPAYRQPASPPPVSEPPSGPLPDYSTPTPDVPEPRP